MSDLVVECVGVRKRFGATRAVEDVSLALEAGSILALVGPSGCGKTTLLRIIAGFETPDAGSVSVGGRIVAASGAWLPPEQRHVGMVFQDYALFPHMTVEENVGFGLKGYEKGSRSERITQAMEHGHVGHLTGRYPHQLSGGEQQRVAMVRAVASRPRVLLMDEPFSNLDPQLRAELRQEVKRVIKANGISLIYVTHDQQDAMSMGDTVAVMHQGRLEQSGTPHEVYERPATRFTATFLGAATFLRAEVTAEGLSTEAGFLRQKVSPEAVGRSVDVLIRPDDVMVTLGPGGPCTVEEYHFQGSHATCVLRLSSGTLVQVLQPHSASLREGDSVSVSLAPGHPVCLFPVGGEVALSLDGVAAVEA
jgi:iron(III) transport system ATP-binding protein